MMAGNIIEGTIYYDTGEIFFRGIYDNSQWNNQRPWEPIIKVKGTTYYKNGRKHQEGYFQWGGLLAGKVYYSNGKLKFEGIYNDKHKKFTKENGEVVADDGTVLYVCDKECTGSYYGPAYPISGKYYDEEGNLLYDGEFQVGFQGGVGFPIVKIPEGFELEEKDKEIISPFWRDYYAKAPSSTCKEYIRLGFCHSDNDAEDDNWEDLHEIEKKLDKTDWLYVLHHMKGGYQRNSIEEKMKKYGMI